MKRFFPLLILFLLISPVLSLAQDAALEERLSKLQADIDDLKAARIAQAKQIDEIARGLSRLEDQLNRPNASYASQEDLKRLTESLREIDRKRIADNDVIIKQIADLPKTLANASRPAPTTPPRGGNAGAAAPPATPGRFYEHVVREGETVSAIAKAYRDENNIKVTVDDILAANRGLDPTKMRVGQKIIVPAQ